MIVKYKLRHSTRLNNRNNEKLQDFTNIRGVVGGSEYEFGCSIITRTDVRDIRLSLDQVLGATKIAELQDARFGVKKQILRLNVSVTDTQRMDVSQAPKELVHVQFNKTYRNSLFGFAIVTCHFVNCLGNKL